MVHILAVIPSCYIVFSRVIIQCVAPIKNLPRSTMGQEGVSNIAVFYTERAYANPVSNNDMDYIIATLQVNFFP